MATSHLPTLRTLASGLVLAVLASACATTEMAVDGDFPSPVVERLPVRLGVFFDPSFSTHSHFEDIPDVGAFTIDTGAANLRLFDRILPPMFTAVVKVDAPDGGADVDAVLVPRIDDFQFSVPLQTRSDFSEVWIRYQMELLRPDGELIASWPLTAYGKSPSATMKSQKAALNEAAMLALRDAGAFFAIRFADTPGVREWLDDRRAPLVSGNTD